MESVWAPAAKASGREAAAIITTPTSPPFRLVRARPDPSPPPADDAAPAESLPRLQRPSKTRRKAESHELQSLGAALLDLSDDRLAEMGLGEPLRDAIKAYKRMRSHEARRRQMQLIGKLMRSTDV